MQAIKSIFESLVYDNELVHTAKNGKVDENILYTRLISGKITLKEYLSML